MAQIPSAGMLHSWRWIFLVEGLVTTAVGVGAYFCLPHRAATASWLTPDEKTLAVERMEDDYRSDEASQARPSSYEYKTAFCSIFSWTVAIAQGCIYCTVTSMALFMPSIIASLGYATTKAQLLTVPPYTAACILCVTVAYFSDRIGKRGIFLCMLFPLAITGFAVLMGTTLPGVKYMAVFFCTMGSFPSAAATLTWGTTNAGSVFGRAIASALIICIGTPFGIAATWSYPSTDGPRYMIGHAVNLAMNITGLLVSIALISYVRYENNLRKSGGRDSRLQEMEVSKLGRRSPYFLYSE